uniref:Uncharacterized protein n=1 Tax=Candidatus Methanophagaceae archaeon ANME-1 ERB6 TaxID=2759912 RepID=A0A7G9YZH6_9EURY|nr:hypothetical protein JNHLJEBA_00020 [Methanosarcinales archaeon ANME-1 ERB6]
MLKPAYKIQIGPETFEPDASSEVISIWASRDMDMPADSFEIMFGISNMSSRIREGDDASIQLGYGDKLERAKDLKEEISDKMENTKEHKKEIDDKI